MPELKLPPELEAHAKEISKALAEAVVAHAINLASAIAQRALKLVSDEPLTPREPYGD